MSVEVVPFPSWSEKPAVPHADLLSLAVSGRELCYQIDGNRLNRRFVWLAFPFTTDLKGEFLACGKHRIVFKKLPSDSDIDISDFLGSDVPYQGRLWDGAPAASKAEQEHRYPTKSEDQRPLERGC